MNEQWLVLRQVIHYLEEAQIDYMVSGSMAMNYYAKPRMTRNIDLVVELWSGQVSTLIARFETDFYLDAEMIQQAVAQTGFFNAIHYDYAVKIDFVVRKPTPYRRHEFSRRQRAEIAGVPLWLVTAEDLLLSKLVWAKESLSELQLNDVRNLLVSVPNLEWDYLHHWAKELEITELFNQVRKL